MSRQRLTLPSGITTVDTGLTQVNRGVDPPLDGEDPTATTPGIASRVMVMPLLPVDAFAAGNVQHGEPYLGPNGTVLVDFFVSSSVVEVTVNVLFWDPHTVITPMDADVYTTFQCTAPGPGGSGQQSGAGPNFTLFNPGTGVGQIVAFLAVRVADNFASPTSNPTPDEAGWTTVRRGSMDLGGDTGIKFACFIRPSLVSDPVLWGFSWTAVSSSYCSQLLVFSPIDATTPVQADAPTVNVGPADPLAVNAPSLATVATALPTLVCAFVIDRRETLVTDPTGMALLGGNETLAPDLELAMYLYFDPFLSPGPTGVRTATFDDPDDDPVTGLGYSITLAPSCGIFPTP